MKTILNNTMVSNKKEGANTMIKDLFEASYNVQTARAEGLYKIGQLIDKNVLEDIEVINCDRIESYQRTLAIASYTIGSLVGATTVGADLYKTLLTNPEQYFNEDGSLNVAKVKKVVKGFGKKKTNPKKYESVFSDVNSIYAINRNDRTSLYVRVSAHEVAEFIRRIENIDVANTTKEDLQAIAKDMDIIGRALQELAIDVTKDKSKDIGYNIKNLVEANTKAYSRIIKKATKIENNLNDIFKEKAYSGKASTQYRMWVDKPVALKDADMDSSTQGAGAMIEDISGECMEVINSGYSDVVNGLVGLYNKCDANVYNRFISKAEAAKNPTDLQGHRVAYMIKCCRAAMASINTLFAMKSASGAGMDSAYIREEAKKIRAALYTEGNKVEMSPEEVVRVAIASSFCRINSYNKISIKANPSMTALWTIFPKEFVLEYVAEGGSAKDALKTMLTVDYVNYDLCLGDELYFEDGMTDTEFGVVELVEEYTGRAIVTEHGIEAVVDHYEYEPVNAAFLSAICKENTYVKGEPLEGMEYYKESDDLELSSFLPVYNEINENCATAKAVSAHGKEESKKLYIMKADGHISCLGELLSRVFEVKLISKVTVSDEGGVVFFK